ncbi:hypothetical protein PYW07_000024 [Mythimna separata]|uniref:Uncharacterized protein n=1 Tax=Mythimna separata TaxID=271217 RepID=A0AAD7Z3L2_MYTSE|nr:hypothetical protein PYW07_000024 [Mythimna separata]
MARVCHEWGASLLRPPHAFQSRSYYLLGRSANHPTDAEHDLYYFRLSASRYLMLCRGRGAVAAPPGCEPLHSRCMSVGSQRRLRRLGRGLGADSCLFCIIVFYSVVLSFLFTLSFRYFAVNWPLFR